jgi:hypothetical protein
MINHGIDSTNYPLCWDMGWVMGDGMWWLIGSCLDHWANCQLSQPINIKHSKHCPAIRSTSSRSWPTGQPAPSSAMFYKSVWFTTNQYKSKKKLSLQIKSRNVKAMFWCFRWFPQLPCVPCTSGSPSSSVLGSPTTMATLLRSRRVPCPLSFKLMSSYHHHHHSY